MPRLIAVVLALGLCCFAQTPSALESDPQGWKDIMPSADFAGWVRVPWMGVGQLNPESQWKVDAQNKVLICEGNKGHELLQYNQEVADAIFHAEFRYTKIEGGKGYNSGILIRNSADGSTYVQAQAGEEGTGYLFGSSPVNGQPQRWNLRAEMKENRMKPAGEWNVVEVKAVGPKVTAWVNGGVVSEAATVPLLKGYVGLEAEGYRIEFRNLKLKELK